MEMTKEYVIQFGEDGFKALIRRPDGKLVARVCPVLEGHENTHDVEIEPNTLLDQGGKITICENGYHYCINEDAVKIYYYYRTIEEEFPAPGVAYRSKGETIEIWMVRAMPGYSLDLYGMYYLNNKRVSRHLVLTELIEIME